MSRRGKNNVKRAIVNDATSIFGGAAEPTKIATHNFNPLFHYLQTMFPNYDNAVLNAVLEQEGNSIERAIEVLLTFAAPEPKGRPINEKEASTLDEIAFSDLSDTDDTPSNVFTLPVMPPVTSQNSGRDHVSLYEYRKKRKTTKSQRARRRQRAQAQAAAALAAQNKVKKVKWVPLQEFIAETKNPFDSLAGGDDELVRLLQPSGVELPATDYGAFEQKPAVEVEDDTVDEDETQSLLTQDEIEESWRNFEATQEIDEPQPQLNVEEEEEEAQEPTLESSIESSADDFGNSNTYEWLHYTPPSPQQQLLELDEESCSPSSSSEEEEDFVVIEEQQPATQPIELLPVEVPAPVVVVPSNAVEQQQEEEAKKDEPVVVVKLYYSASDIHRLGLRRSAFTFVKLFDYAAAYLQGKCQQLARSALPRAFALTYVDDEGDVIHLCSEEELAEALRLHEEVFWVDGKQPLLRVHIKALDVAANDGHIVIGA